MEAGEEPQGARVCVPPSSSSSKASSCMPQPAPPVSATSICALARAASFSLRAAIACEQGVHATHKKVMEAGGFQHQSLAQSCRTALRSCSTLP